MICIQIITVCGGASCNGTVFRMASEKTARELHSGIGLPLPEIINLKKVFKLPLILMFVGVVASGTGVT
jgi:hypothetical protein